MPSLRMYEDQCKADREGADSDASSSEPAAGRDPVHSPLGASSSPLRFSRAGRGETPLVFYSHSRGGKIICAWTEKKTPGGRLVYFLTDRQEQIKQRAHNKAVTSANGSGVFTEREKVSRGYARLASL